jgi:hypothetical protein
MTASKRGLGPSVLHEVLANYRSTPSELTTRERPVDGIVKLFGEPVRGTLNNTSC